VYEPDAENPSRALGAFSAGAAVRANVRLSQQLKADPERRWISAIRVNRRVRRGDLPSPVPRHPPAPLTERQRDESSKNRGFAKPALYTEDLVSDVRGRYPPSGPPRPQKKSPVYTGDFEEGGPVGDAGLAVDAHQWPDRERA
jgi:hypothetical protein